MKSYLKFLSRNKAYAAIDVFGLAVSMMFVVRKVMGGTSGEVMVMLVRTFMQYVLIAAVISVPVIYYVMNDWLSQFSYRIEVYWWICAVSVLLAIVICLVSVVAQCTRAANSNPVKSLQ